MTATLHSGAGLLELLQVCFKLPADEREQFEAFTGTPYSAERLAAMYFGRGPVWTMMADGNALMVAGFDLIRPGVYQDWALTTPEAWDKKHWRTTTRLARRVMDEMLRSGASRLQCVSLASRTCAHRWYRVLGLELEGTLRSYGANGEDAMMFSRLRTE